MHVTGHWAPPHHFYGSKSHWSKTWHFLTCLDYFIWMLIFPGLIPLQFKLQQNSSYLQFEHNVLFSSSLVVHLVHAYFSFKPVFRPKKGLVPLQEERDECDTKVPERIPAKGQRTTHICHRHCIICWPDSFSQAPCFRRKRKSSPSQMYFLCTFSG